MPVYILHGFRWPRAGFTGIRVWIVLNNLEDATAEYLQQPLTSRLVLDSLKRAEPDLMPRLPDLQLIEQYDPEDLSETAVSQPFAYVGAKVITIPDPGTPGSGLSWNLQDLMTDPGLSPATSKALEGLRDKIAPGEKIGWWVVYNGDPDRYYPQTDDDDEIMEDEDYDDESEEVSIEEPPRSTNADKPTNRFNEKLTRLFGRKNNTATAA